jgi:signal transduction histidine kinase
MVMNMNRNSIRWRLPVSYAVVALIAALTLGSLMLLVLRNYYADQEQEFLLGNALTLEPMIESTLQSGIPRGILQEQVQSLAFLSQAQIRVLGTNGQVVADSGVPKPDHIVTVLGESKKSFSYDSGPAAPLDAQGPIIMYSSSDQRFPQVFPFNQEIPYSGPASEGDFVLRVNASPYGYGFVTRAESDLVRRSSQVVSVLLTDSNGRKLGVLEFSNGPSYGTNVISSVSNAWLFASVFAIVIAAFAGWFMSKRVTQPVLLLENATRQMERGNLSVRVDLQAEKQQEFISLANSFNGMAEQVEQTISTLRAFVADAAHELHTPLTALQANLELARDEKTASTRTRYLLRAQEQGQRLEALVKSLLDLSRIEAAESQPDFAPVDLIQLVREVGEQFASRAEQTDRSLTMNIPEAAVNVLGNETQLRQVVSNLLENALKFTPASGAISLDLERPADEITLTVSDSGIGIPFEDLPHLFERFHRGRNVSEYGGNGLGLAIVKAIVESHSGTVEAQSDGLGMGSRFVVRL